MRLLICLPLMKNCVPIPYPKIWLFQYVHNGLPFINSFLLEAPLENSLGSKVVFILEKLSFKELSESEEVKMIAIQ